MQHLVRLLHLQHRRTSPRPALAAGDQTPTQAAARAPPASPMHRAHSPHGTCTISPPPLLLPVVDDNELWLQQGYSLSAATQLHEQQQQRHQQGAHSASASPCEQRQSRAAPRLLMLAPRHRADSTDLPAGMNANANASGPPARSAYCVQRPSSALDEYFMYGKRRAPPPPQQKLVGTLMTRSEHRWLPNHYASATPEQQSSFEEVAGAADALTNGKCARQTSFESQLLHAPSTDILSVSNLSLGDDNDNIVESNTPAAESDREREPDNSEPERETAIEDSIDAASSSCTLTPLGPPPAAFAGNGLANGARTSLTTRSRSPSESVSQLSFSNSLAMHAAHPLTASAVTSSQSVSCMCACDASACAATLVAQVTQVATGRIIDARRECCLQLELESLLELLPPAPLAATVQSAVQMKELTATCTSKLHELLFMNSPTSATTVLATNATLGKFDKPPNALAADTLTCHSAADTLASPNEQRLVVPPNSGGLMPESMHNTCGADERGDEHRIAERAHTPVQSRPAALPLVLVSLTSPARSPAKDTAREHRADSPASPPAGAGARGEYADGVVAVQREREQRESRGSGNAGLSVSQLGHQLNPRVQLQLQHLSSMSGGKSRRNILESLDEELLQCRRKLVEERVVRVTSFTDRAAHLTLAGVRRTAGATGSGGAAPAITRAKRQLSVGRSNLRLDARPSIALATTLATSFAAGTVTALTGINQRGAVIFGQRGVDGAASRSHLLSPPVVPALCPSDARGADRSVSKCCPQLSPALHTQCTATFCLPVNSDGESGWNTSLRNALRRYTLSVCRFSIRIQPQAAPPSTSLRVRVYLTRQMACLLLVVSCSLSKLRSDPNQLILSVGDTITPAVLKNAFWSHSRHRLKCSLTAPPKPGTANTQLSLQTPRLGRRGRRESLIRKSLRRLRSLERTITSSSDSEEARDDSCDEEAIAERCTRESLQLAEAIASYTATPTAGTPQSALRRGLQARAALSPSDAARVTEAELGQFLVLQHLAQSCLNDPWIANELFLQLVKHTTEHPGTSYSDSLNYSSGT